MRSCFAIQLTAFLFVATAVAAVEIKSATYLHSFEWRDPATWFGGFSALQVSDDGQQILVLSDRARMATAQIERDSGRITNIRVLDQWRILSSQGHIMKGGVGDSEGLALAPSGGVYISFEGVHRVAYYAARGARSRVLPRLPEFDDLADNGSFEGLAIDARGWLYTIPEKDRTADGDIPVYRWNGDAWSIPFVLPQREGFKPVGADFGPDGKFYLLERKLGFIGFRSRLRRWEVTDDVLSAEETLFETAAGIHDNLEGVSVWRDGQGRLRATMISDDNFLALQRTELVEYLLPD
ncbi:MULTISPECIES: esterase-like activity of phytase family protein [unclassified Ruegeria]|uniref:esterase-like activity of phytase family protein n=1 Tax=unclassified Ruegeria TaxID=2625375 RepID=UPI001490D0FA|nr:MULTISPECIES: esterase-like activity of phytase family protein [unclassified Ruegeria]NOD48760.1 esterase-like activity of phytase family protein [Ruegeria sp. HKCCD5849]NOD51937.1 esterase-like activity of phytase family protein [Ruegeria sp. HKCCD5851]NOD66595.1 esterase-like activity of phytase family protein [Ruegeria sp. HKCCD7303]